MEAGEDEADPAAAADMAALFKDRKEDAECPDEAQWPEWSGYIREAWDELINDRHIGTMGGQGRIYFSSIKDYADQYGITGSEFDVFRVFLRAIDDEYLAVMSERAEVERKARETQGTS